jgi:hypothetical protein
LSLVYLVAMSGVAAVMLAVILDAVRSASRKPSWAEPKRPMLAVVETEERRRQQLPFVGQERRLPERHEERAAREAA